MSYRIAIQRKEIDAFASLNPKGMPPRPVAAQKEKPVVIAKTTTSQPAVVIESANFSNGVGHAELAPTSLPAPLPATVTKKHPTKAECDLYLWNNLGDPHTLESRKEVYAHMINLPPERNNQ